MSEFGINLRDLRKSRKLTQQELAELINSNQANITAWERGERTPSLSTIQHVADTLHVPLSSLISMRNSGAIDDEERELVDLIRSNPKIRTIVDKSRYLSNADLNMLIDVIGALTRTRV